MDPPLGADAAAGGGAAALGTGGLGLQRLVQAEAAGHAGSAAPRGVVVLPYSFRLDPVRQAAVAPALATWLGPGLQCHLQPGLALGDEDQPAQWLPAALGRLAADATGHGAQAPLLVLLFALTATPERESHGAVVQAVVQALAALPAPRPQLRVAVDIAGYRQRLPGPDGDEWDANVAARVLYKLIGFALSARP